MENIKVNVSSPKLVFMLEGAEQAAFDFYEYDSIVTKAYADRDGDQSKDVVLVVGDWMRSKGLPASVPYIAIADWMIAVDKHLGEMAKKAIGS